MGIEDSQQRAVGAFHSGGIAHVYADVAIERNLRGGLKRAWRCVLVADAGINAGLHARILLRIVYAPPVGQQNAFVPEPKQMRRVVPRRDLRRHQRRPRLSSVPRFGYTLIPLF